MFIFQVFSFHHDHSMLYSPKHLTSVWEYILKNNKIYTRLNQGMSANYWTFLLTFQPVLYLPPLSVIFVILNLTNYMAWQLTKYLTGIIGLIINLTALCVYNLKNSNPVYLTLSHLLQNILYLPLTPLRHFDVSSFFKRPNLLCLLVILAGCCLSNRWTGK
jgi:hypothetical protein